MAIPTVNQELFHKLGQVLNLKPGINYFLYGLPPTLQVKSKTWWLVPEVQTLANHFIDNGKDYLITYTLNYRAMNPEEIDRQTAFAQEVINNLKCFDLPHYSVVRCQASSTNPDEDLDIENLWRGSLVITLRIIESAPKDFEETPDKK